MKGRTLLLLLLAGGCSIEGARQVGDTCLSDRECASPLRCELTPTGSMRCVRPSRVDAALEDLVALDATPVESGAPEAGAADLSAAVDTPESAVNKVDAPVVTDANDAGD